MLYCVFRTSYYDRKNIGYVIEERIRKLKGQDDYGVGVQNNLGVDLNFLIRFWKKIYELVALIRIDYKL